MKSKPPMNSGCAYRRRPSAVRGRLAMAVAFGAWLSLPLAGAHLYVAPNGTPSGPGRLDRPYDLPTVLAGRVAHPGDTFWLRGGLYRLGKANTKLQGLPGQPITIRQLAGERARIQGSITIFESLGHVVFRDFELFSADTNRISSQVRVGFHPTDIKIVPGIASYAPNVSWINLIIHDHVRHGIYISELSSNNLVYGCIIYNNGWVSPDNAEGHSLYVQSAGGPQVLMDNIAFNSAGANFHVYESAPGKTLTRVTLEGNVAFHAGGLSRTRRYRDWIVGTDAPAGAADAIQFLENFGYHHTGSPSLPQVQIGRDGTNGTVVIMGNYMRLGLQLNRWAQVIFFNNVFIPVPLDQIVRIPRPVLAAATPLTDPSPAQPVDPFATFAWNSSLFDFSGWSRTAGVDQKSAPGGDAMTGIALFVRPNRYEPGRAHIVVYNWDQRSTIPVDVGNVLARGKAYTVRNVQDLSAPPVLEGVFDGSPLLLPMRAMSVAPPTGRLPTPPPTGPIFHVFLLVAQPDRLQVRRTAGHVEISWPIGLSSYQLQSTPQLSEGVTWTDHSARPALEGERLRVTEAIGAEHRYFRLRPPKF